MAFYKWSSVGVVLLLSDFTAYSKTYRIVKTYVLTLQRYK